jgi:hypothetical protein
MPEGWYPHEPGDPFYELEWVFLHEHPEICGAIGRRRGVRAGHRRDAVDGAVDRCAGHGARQGLRSGDRRYRAPGSYVSACRRRHTSGGGDRHDLPVRLG